MFFYAAVRNWQLGRYALAKMCIDAFYEPCLNWGKAALDGMMFDDWNEISYDAKRIWPNWG
jgi:hypothetical protein